MICFGIWPLSQSVGCGAEMVSDWVVSEEKIQQVMTLFFMWARTKTWLGDWICCSLRFPLILWCVQYSLCIFFSLMCLLLSPIISNKKSGSVWKNIYIYIKKKNLQNSYPASSLGHFILKYPPDFSFWNGNILDSASWRTDITSRVLEIQWSKALLNK